MLKDMLRRGPVSPGESVASSINENGIGADDGDDWMDVDEISSGPSRTLRDVYSKPIPRSSAPTLLDPTVKPSTTAVVNITPPIENLAASPSASFAKLTLMSPILPSLSPSPTANNLSHAIVHRNTGSPSPLSQTAQIPLVASDYSLVGQPDYSDASRSIPGPSSLRSQWNGPEPTSKADANITTTVLPANSKSRHPPLPAHISEKQRTSEGTEASQEPYKPLDESEFLHANGHSPHELINIATPPSHQLPSPLPPPPPTPKVKLSLKDFALRKRRQREEEIARTISLPPQSTNFVGTSDRPRVNGGGVKMNGNGDVNGNAKGNIIAKADEDVDMAIESHDMPPELGARDSKLPVPDGMVEDDAHILYMHMNTAPILDSLAQMHSSLTPPSPLMVTDTHGHISNGSDSLKAKIELMDAPVLDVTLVPQGHNVKNSPPPPSPNRSAPEHCSDQTTGDVSNLSSHIRRLSQEDGEIRGLTPPKQPFVLHTPPTQPRSFQNVPTSPSSASTASSSIQPRRPSQPPPLQPNRPPATPGPVSRPLPSGPRAFRAAIHLGSSTGIHPPNRLFSGPHLIPRGPSADRERLDRDRERQWVTRSRGRGTGGSGWGR